MQISAEGLFFLPIYGIIELGGEMEELKKRKIFDYGAYAAGTFEKTGHAFR